MPLTLMYITNDLDTALVAQKNGVERIWIDLETIGKEIRQKGLDTVKSHHKISDIYKIKPYLNTSSMMVRVNCWHDDSYSEINSVIDSGADYIMLPYWKSLDEVKYFIEAVRGRSKTILLLETKEAVECIDEVIRNGGFDEIHIGLNDLHLSYGMTFMFELLTNGVVERLCEKFRRAGIPFGYGGIAKIGEGTVPAERIVLEHYRMGSSRVILSRSFCDRLKYDDFAKFEQDFESSIVKLREFEKYATKATEEDLLLNRKELEKSVNQVVTEISQKEKWS